MKSIILLGRIDDNFARDFYDWLSGAYFSEDGYSPLGISSPGGDVGLMIGIYDQIIYRDIPTIALGIVQSAAAVLFLAGKTRYMYPNSMLMFHEPARPKGSDDFEDPEWYLHTKLVAMVVQRTGMDLIEAHDLFDGKFISAERALQLGLCDKILNLGGQDGGTSGISVSEGYNFGYDINGDPWAEPFVG